MNRIIKITLITIALSISGAGFTSHEIPSSGCIVVQEKPYKTTVKQFETLDECRAEVQKLIRSDSGWIGYINDSQNKIGIEAYNYIPGMSFPLFLDRK